MTSRALRPGRRAFWKGALRFLVLAVGVVPLILLRHKIAAAFTRSAMKSRGLLCKDITANVPLALRLDEVRLAPMRCRMNEGAVHSIHFKTTVVVKLDGLEPASVHTDAIDIDLRSRAHPKVELNVMGDLMSIGGFDEPLVELIFDGASMSLRGLPTFSCAHMNVTRTGEPLAILHDVQIRPHTGGTRIIARSAKLEGCSDLVGPVHLDLWVTAKRAGGTVAFANGLHADVAATQLAGPHPEVDFAIVPSSLAGRHRAERYQH